MSAKSWRRQTERGLIAVLAWLAATAAYAQTAISTDGTIESKAGGFKFPDGTVQTTAAELADPCANPNDPADEMIQVGGVCIDKYEASVWSSPTGGTQYGLDVNADGMIDPGSEYPCDATGQDCKDEIYARSIQGAQPSAFITWFQAQQALANSGKRLPTNAEWQTAAAGTPDNGFCNVLGGSASDTGTFGTCFSDWGAFDMVGNLWEWVADWGDSATACDNWSPTYGDDISCVGLGDGETNSHLPGAVNRGGGFIWGTDAGPFAVGASHPALQASHLGFRGAR